MCVCSFLYSLFFFFFSSRRRHTRSLCDWSSDVCSSDLMRLSSLSTPGIFPGPSRERSSSFSRTSVTSACCRTRRSSRSEERRVGKECRCRWARGDEKKKRRGREKHGDSEGKGMQDEWTR